MTFVVIIILLINLSHCLRINLLSSRYRSRFISPIESTRFEGENSQSPTQIISSKGRDIFEKLLITKKRLTPEILADWDERIIEVTTEIKKLRSVKELLDVYDSFLELSSYRTLDAIRTATFEAVAIAVADSLSAMKAPRETSTLNAMIDAVTDRHLDFIERFRVEIDDGGSDGYSQSARQEFLCYQFAGLSRIIFQRLNTGVGDLSEGNSMAMPPDMRLENWMSPIYARLQRRFVRFLASNVDEKLASISAGGMDSLLSILSYTVSPRYSLLSTAETATTDNSGLVGAPSYPAQDLAGFLNRVLRVFCAGNSDLTSAEAKIAVSFKSALSLRMAGAAVLLEKLWIGPLKRHWSPIQDPVGLHAAEEMLNAGHDTVAGVLSVWNIRYNIVGVQKDGVGDREKEYLRPVVFGAEGVLTSLPKYMRNEVSFEVKELTSKLKPPSVLESAALLAFAVRTGAAEEFRSTLAFSTDQDALPQNRDATFSAVLAVLLTQTLTSPEPVKASLLYENLVAIVALEEALGVREPREAVRQAYGRSLFQTLAGFGRDKSAIPSDLASRIEHVETALAMVCRLPEGSGTQCRLEAFRDATNDLLSSQTVAFADVMDNLQWVAEVLAIEAEAAQGYVKSAGASRFDRAVGQLMMDADVARSVPGMGPVYLEQLRGLGQSLGMSVEETEERAVYVGANVFAVIMDTVLEASRFRREDQFDSLLRRSCAVLRHPVMEEVRPRTVLKPLEVGVKLAAAKLGNPAVGQILKVLDSLKKKVAALASSPSSISTQGWGEAARSDLSESSVADEELLEYLASLQALFMQEYAKGSLRR